MIRAGSTPRSNTSWANQHVASPASDAVACGNESGRSTKSVVRTNGPTANTPTATPYGRASDRPNPNATTNNAIITKNRVADSPNSAMLGRSNSTYPCQYRK